MALSPPARRRRAEQTYEPREITEEDLYPLRVDAEWRPTQVLSVYGNAVNDTEYLARLLVASAILQGVHRVRDMAERLLQTTTVQSPRIAQMIADDSLAQKKSQLEDISVRLDQARAELNQTRARASNDLDSEPQNPDGLRALDLAILTSHTQVVIMAHEIVSRRNITGISFGLRVASGLPDQAYAEKWMDRLLGTSQMRGILLFNPPEYGRLIIVYDDGRLAYDPYEIDDEDDE